MKSVAHYLVTALSAVLCVCCNAELAKVESVEGAPFSITDGEVLTESPGGQGPGNTNQEQDTPTNSVDPNTDADLPAGNTNDTPVDNAPPDNTPVDDTNNTPANNNQNGNNNTVTLADLPPRISPNRVYVTPAATPGFDCYLYLNRYGDLAASFGNNCSATGALGHWQANGTNEGRVGALLFNISRYQSLYGDIAPMTRAQAYSHFVSFGIDEGRSGSAHFDPVFYLNNNADVRNAVGPNNWRGAWAHFVAYGIHECRQGSAAFDIYAYINVNPSLDAAYGTHACYQAMMDIALNNYQLQPGAKTTF